MESGSEICIVVPMVLFLIQSLLMIVFPVYKTQKKRQEMTLFLCSFQNQSLSAQNPLRDFVHSSSLLYILLRGDEKEKVGKTYPWRLGTWCSSPNQRRRAQPRRGMRAMIKNTIETL